jgi:hypothetical protein
VKTGAQVLSELELVPERCEFTHEYVRASGTTPRALDAVVRDVHRLFGGELMSSGDQWKKRREFVREADRLICLEWAGQPGCQIILENEHGASLTEAVQAIAGIEFVGGLAEFGEQERPSQFRTVVLQNSGWSLKAYGQFRALSEAQVAAAQHWMAARGLVADAEGRWSHPAHPLWVARASTDEFRADLNGGPLEE